MGILHIPQINIANRISSQSSLSKDILSRLIVFRWAKNKEPLGIELATFRTLSVNILGSI